MFKSLKVGWLVTKVCIVVTILLGLSILIPALVSAPSYIELVVGLILALVFPFIIVLLAKWVSL